MIERGLYATFLAQPDLINQTADLMRQHTTVAVMNAIAALTNDGLFRAEKNTRPVKYRPTPRKRVHPHEQLMLDCLHAYNELRDAAWTKHRIVTRTLKKSLTAFITQVGPDNALDTFKRGIKAQADGWAKGKNVDLVNLLTNDKVIRFAEQATAANEYEPGMVYRLAIGKPHPQLRAATSYALRLDSRQNGTVTGLVFPEGDPSDGVLVSLPTGALATPIRDWSAYQHQLS